MKTERSIALASRWDDDSQAGSTLTSRADLLSLLIFYLVIYQLVYLHISPLSCLCMCCGLFGYAYLERLRLEWVLERLEIQLVMGEGVRRGQSIEVKLKIINPTRIDIRRFSLNLKLPSLVSSTLSRELPAHHQLDLSCLLRCDHLNSGHLWGLELSICDSLGLMTAIRRDYVPRKANVHSHLGGYRVLKSMTSHQESRSAMLRIEKQKRGLDGDFVELREYQASDPLNHIAWKPSARRGKLLTRVFEHPRERKFLIAVDVNPLMRTPLFEDSRCALALDRLSTELFALSGEQVGVVVFDHRVLSHIPVTPQRFTIRRAREIIPLLAQPLFYDSVAETQDELWERLSDYVRWSGESRLNSGQRLISEPIMSSSLRLRHSFSIDQLKQWLEERGDPEDIPYLGSLGEDRHDHLLRYLCYQVGISMTSPLPRSSQALHQGLSDIIKIVREERVTDLIIISHSQRLQQRADLTLLRQWMGQERRLKWVQVGCIHPRLPKPLSLLKPHLTYEPILLTPYEEEMKRRRSASDSSSSTLIQWRD